MSRKKGFTLIELLVAITLISLLASMAIASYSASRRHGRNAKRRGDMVALQQAFEQYYIDNGTYDADCNTMVTNYIQGTFPSDPLSTGTPYATSCVATSYCICALLEGGGGGNSSDSACTFGTGDWFCKENQQ
ncbi:prepilin-type N-terminal cleavage/methylation domain-containing protein [Patescibacteria group bacterium]|nr:prepilin-type N-terminal cleavage/methylation domain-containing protein [Patescibacteria group bacterium]